MTKFFANVKRAYQKFDVWCNKVFDGFFNFFRKHLLLIAILVLFACSLAIRLSFYEYVSGDAYGFLLKWLEYLKANGGFLALKDYPNFTPTQCDYPLMYVYLLAMISYIPCSEILGIKCISIFFEYLLAFGAYKLVKEFTKNKIVAFSTLVAFFFMPTGILNSSLWGQCDAIYSCGIVWALYFLIKDKPVLSMTLVGLCFSVKIHTIFFAPAIIYFWLTKKVSLRQMLLIPLTIFLTFIPGYIFGVPFEEPFMVYVTQMGKYPNPSYGAANIWELLNFTKNGSYVSLFNKNGGPIILAFSVIALALLFLFYYKVPSTKKNMVYITTLFALLTPFVLPHMHERYFYLADVFIIIYVLVMRRRYYLIALMQLSSVLCYTHFLFGSYIFKFLGTDTVPIAALINLLIIIFVIKDYKYLDKKETQEETSQVIEVK